MYDISVLTASAGSGNLFLTLIPLVLLVVFFYFFIIRPQKKQDKKRFTDERFS